VSVICDLVAGAVGQVSDCRTSYAPTRIAIKDVTCCWFTVTGGVSSGPQNCGPVDQLTYPFTTAFDFPHTTPGATTQVKAVCCAWSINTDNTCVSPSSPGFYGSNYVSMRTGA
jgi:hypothetical protein